MSSVSKFPLPPGPSQYLCFSDEEDFAVPPNLCTPTGSQALAHAPTGAPRLLLQRSLSGPLARASPGTQRLGALHSGARSAHGPSRFQLSVFSATSNAHTGYWPYSSPRNTGFFSNKLPLGITHKGI